MCNKFNAAGLLSLACAVLGFLYSWQNYTEAPVAQYQEVQNIVLEHPELRPMVAKLLKRHDGTLDKVDVSDIQHQVERNRLAKILKTPAKDLPPPTPDIMVPSNSRLEPPKADKSHASITTIETPLSIVISPL